MKIGIPKEIHLGEKRVATTPEVVEILRKLGFSMAIEKGAGDAASFSDEVYHKAGAEIIDDPETLWASSDIIFKVRGPEVDPSSGKPESDLLREGGHLISFLWPAQNPRLVESMAQRKATVLAMDCIPRISRAQKMDALSSMANIGGYRAVIEAAHHFGRFFTGQITAAGKIPPAKVLVIGVGVAGLAAIGAARGLGAIVRASDTRPEVKDQIKSLGAEFVDVDFKEEGTGLGGYAKVMSEGYQKAQKELYARQAAEVDIIITTALIPGKPAPKLITAAMVESMKPGSVIVDMAAEQGGNCELTSPHEVVVRHGVTIIGYADLPSRLARQSSTLYANNLLHLMEDLCPNKDGLINVNMEDEVIRGATIIKEGQITWPPPQKTPPIAPSAAPPAPAVAKHLPKPIFRIPHRLKQFFLHGFVVLILYKLGMSAPASFMPHLNVFILACFVGYLVIWNVKPSLHTPLMSVTNAISSIIAIGALVQISSPSFLIMALVAFALMLTAINMSGGFLVTQRMLNMFRK